ncbi:hypothetical protein LWI28_003881 [Acer negundo]|uniref:Calcium-transporting ATPase n=1 Tax=Acer negundo TaxID=4023 RepID=A0AAD5NJI2_ACENE|nr:hypothetical protein LWI28_003881 [Acer negundo]
MESYLNENFGVQPKHTSEEVLGRWRNLCGVVKNPKRRFRFTANLSKRYEAAAMRRTNQEKLRIAVLVSKAAIHFLLGVSPSDYTVPENVKDAGFQVCADELSSIVEGHDVKKLKFHGDVDGLAEKLSTSTTDGLNTNTDQFNRRKEIYGINKFAEAKLRSFWIFDVSTNASSLCSEIPDSSLKLLLQTIFNNTGGEVVANKDGKREILGSPTETALLEFALSLGGDFHAERRATKTIKVEPFNSTKKRMGVVLELPEGGMRAHTKGASEIVLAACDKVINSDGEVVPLDEESVKHLNLTINQFANEALRTLCLAYIDLENKFSPDDSIPVSGYTCIGIVGIKDPVRPGVKESVALCRSAGITVRMVTGDNINTAKAIARECGILTDDGIAIEGPDFREKKMEDLLELIPKIQVMARSSPLDKHTLVKHLRTTFEEVVAVTGDGTNDAPALHEADIGLAMGIAGTEVAKESADVIILDDNFSTIVTVAKWGRSVYINIQKFVQFQLTVNIVALVVNFSSACLTGTAPLTAVQLLWRNGEAIFGLVGPDSGLILNTLIFNSFVFCQIFNEISSREMEEINVFRGILDNYVFVVVLGVTVLFQIIIIEFLGTFANTAPLTLTQWFVSILIGFVGMPIAAALKKVPV